MTHNGATSADCGICSTSRDMYVHHPGLNCKFIETDQHGKVSSIKMHDFGIHR